MDTLTYVSYTKDTLPFSRLQSLSFKRGSLMRKQFKELIGLHTIVVAARGDKPIGWAIASYARPYYAVINLYVKRRERGKGIGSRLLHEVDKFCRRQKLIPSVHMEANPEFFEARGMYNANI